MATTTDKAALGVEECSPEEGRALFDAAARRHLGVSGEEFLAKWDAGDYDDDPDNPDVVRVAMLMPFGRP